MSKYNNFIKIWAVISIATCIFSYLLWALMDFDTFVDTGITIEDLCFDIAYCSVYTMFSLLISNNFGEHLCKRQDKLSSLCHSYTSHADSKLRLGCHF